MKKIRRYYLTVIDQKYRADSRHSRARDKLYDIYGKTLFVRFRSVFLFAEFLSFEHSFTRVLYVEEHKRNVNSDKQQRTYPRKLSVKSERGKHKRRRKHQDSLQQKSLTIGCPGGGNH